MESCLPAQLYWEGVTKVQPQVWWKLCVASLGCRFRSCGATTKRALLEPHLVLNHAKRGHQQISKNRKMLMDGDVITGRLDLCQHLEPKAAVQFETLKITHTRAQTYLSQ